MTQTRRFQIRKATNNHVVAAYDTWEEAEKAMIGLRRAYGYTEEWEVHDSIDLNQFCKSEDDSHVWDEHGICTACHKIGR